MLPSVSSHRKELYNPKAFIVHAALLRQAFAYCAIFLTAASRRSLARISVPVWGVTLSGPLSVFALVGRYPTNQLMDRSLIPERLNFPQHLLPMPSVWGISYRFQ